MASEQRPIQLLFRSKEAVELYTLPDTSSTATAAPPPAVKKGGTTLYKGKTTFHVSNPNGSCVYIHDANVGLIKRDITTDSSSSSSSGSSDDAAAGSNKPFLQDSKAIQLAKCSPRGSYLLTWERPNSGSINNEKGNLKVWDAKTGAYLKGFSCKKATLTTLQWTHDEALVFHLVTNEVHIYSSHNFDRVGKARCTGIASFSIPSAKGSPSNNTIPSNKDSSENNNKYLLTAFVPGAKGKPARVDLLRYPDRMGRESSTVAPGGAENNKVNVPSGPSLASKSLFDAEEVTVQWSPRADSALLLTQTAVDATGESYYGSSHLFLLSENDPKRPGFGSAVSVPLPSEATKASQGTTVPIVSAAWMPNPRINGPVPFGVISGRMPALASLHHGVTAEPTFLLGRAHRNTMDVAPHGRFIVCGGYGNLAGGMDFWDRNKGKKIPRRVILPGESNDKYVTIKEASDLTITSSSPVVGHEWSPDSRSYLVSTTSPRMNVDNGVEIHRYDGSLVAEDQLPWENAKYKPDKLLCAEYVPSPLPTEEKSFYYYPDRPQSPPPRGMTELKGEAAKKALAKISTQNSQSNNNGGGSSSAKPAAAAYVPPGARKAGGGGGGAYVPPGARNGAAGRGGGGGTSLAERMRQEREGSAANVSGIRVTKRTGPVGASGVSNAAGGAATASGEKSKSALRKEKQRLAKEKAEREAAEAERRKLEEEKARVEANRADPAKRAKKINKTLKQIEEIKKKAESGEELNDDQKKKMASEDELRKELASLGI